MNEILNKIKDHLQAHNPISSYPTTYTGDKITCQDVQGCGGTSHDERGLMNDQTIYLFLELLNKYRSLLTQAKTHKESTAQSNLEINELNLTIQNHLYKQKHLETEIIKCNEQEMLHSELELPLVYDDHQKMILLLENELRERKDLVERVGELKKEDEKMQLIIDEKTRELELFDEKIDNLLKLAIQIQNETNKEEGEEMQ